MQNHALEESVRLNQSALRYLRLLLFLGGGERRGGV